MTFHRRRDSAIGYSADARWPSERIPGDTWGPMSSIAIGPDDNVWTFNRGLIPIQAYTQEGELVKYWGQGGMFKLPHSLRFDDEGNLWATDVLMHTVRKFSLDGDLLMCIGIPDCPGADETHLNQPTDAAIADNGDVYIADGYGNSRIVVFDGSGKYLRSWGGLGASAGEFNLPHSVALDSQGHVYVADRNNARVQIFNAKGAPVSEWTNIITPWHITITSKDEVFVCGSSPMLWSETPDTEPCLGLPPKDQLFMKLDALGRLHQLWCIPKGEDGRERPGEVNWLHTMALGNGGSLFLGDIKGKRAMKFVRADSSARS